MRLSENKAYSNQLRSEGFDALASLVPGRCGLRPLWRFFEEPPSS